MHFILGFAAFIALVTVGFGQRAAVVTTQVVLLAVGGGAAWVAYMIVTRVLQ